MEAVLASAGPPEAVGHIAAEAVAVGRTATMALLVEATDHIIQAALVEAVGHITTEADLALVADLASVADLALVAVLEEVAASVAAAIVAGTCFASELTFAGKALVIAVVASVVEASGEAADTLAKLAAAYPSRTDCTSKASAMATGTPLVVRPSPCPLAELLGTCPLVGASCRTYPSQLAVPCSFVVVRLTSLLAELESIYL